MGNVWFGVRLGLGKLKFLEKIMSEERRRKLK